MKTDKTPKPPQWAQQLLSWYCRPELLEDLQGDLNECFQRNLLSKGSRKAKLIYIMDVFKFIRFYTLKRPQPALAMTELFVFRNYFKTSLRNMERNKLFSAINITGLAISMCLGLLLIVLISELKSFDNFHKNADHIFRVNSKFQELNGSTYNYATTSLYAGKKIKESVTGIEQVTFIRRGFDKDLQYKDKVVPFHGFWADESFFRIFSFDLLSGNTDALSKPNSVVLTESASRKLFGAIDPIGKQVQVDTVSYMVTAVLRDPPLNSHMKFDMLGSFITLEGEKVASKDNLWLRWDDMWENYVYILLPETTDPLTITQTLTSIAKEGNSSMANGEAKSYFRPIQAINLYLEPLREIALTRNMSNSIGPTVDKSTTVTFGVLAVLVIASACFNYTNLSIARALRRTREVGIRKVVGASKGQVFFQFILESVTLSLLSLGVAFTLFLIIRGEFIAMNDRFAEMVSLKLTPEVCLYSVLLAITVGLIAGLLPASFFSKINAALVFKDLSAVKLFGHLSVRKALIVFQYTLSIFFIVFITIGYKQYRYSLSFDLGFKTDNILSIDLQQNKSELLIKELSLIPGVKGIACAKTISSVGRNSAAGNVRYKDPSDSANIYYNFVDHEYIPLHEHHLLAGENFNPLAAEEMKKSGVIINMHTLKWMKLTDPRDAIGEEIVIDGHKVNVIGVVEDFHYERVNYPIANFAFRYDPQQFEVLNLKVESTNIVATMDRIQAAWKKVDTIHPLQAKFYGDYIQDAYNKLSWLIKFFGFIAFLCITIASLGLLGMVTFTTETRTKEVSIRKVLGASEGNLVLMMSKGFIFLLMIASAIAIPCGYYFMDTVAFGRFAYRAPIGIFDLTIGTIAILLLAFLMLRTQTLRVARANPADVLKNE